MREGLDAIAEERPDIVLFDLNMDDLSGFDFIERLVALPNPPPGIAVTAMVLDDAHRSRLSRAAKIVSKFDVTEETLVDAISEVLDRQKMPQVA